MPVEHPQPNMMGVLPSAMLSWPSPPQRSSHGQLMRWTKKRPGMLRCMSDFAQLHTGFTGWAVLEDMQSLQCSDLPDSCGPVLGLRSYLFATTGRVRYAQTGHGGMQIAYNAEQQQLELEEKLANAKLAGDQESAYQSRVRQASAYDPPTYFGRPKVQWFY